MSWYTCHLPLAPWLILTLKGTRSRSGLQTEMENIYVYKYTAWERRKYVGSRVDGALDSTSTFKARIHKCVRRPCFLRSSTCLSSFFFFFLWCELDCKAHTLQVRGTCLCVYAKLFCCLPLKGLFWTSVGGVQVVCLSHKPCTHNVTGSRGVDDVSCRWRVSSGARELVSGFSLKRRWKYPVLTEVLKMVAFLVFCPRLGKSHWFVYFIFFDQQLKRLFDSFPLGINTVSDYRVLKTVQWHFETIAVIVSTLQSYLQKGAGQKDLE